jgi:hypothetical protein
MRETWPVWLRALLAQASALLITVAFSTIVDIPASVLPPVLLQGGLAVLLGSAMALPVWWLVILSLFIPVLIIALSLELSASSSAAGFLLCWLLFRGNLSGRAPLYVSSHKIGEALAELVLDQDSLSFIDLGCGLAGTICYLAERHKDRFFLGVEAAPLLFLGSHLRVRGRTNCHVRFGDLWSEDLSRYDLVYCFLSPEPMIRLWEKARTEMHSGALLVSNTFVIPGYPPTQIVHVDDVRKTKLLIWRIE